MKEEFLELARQLIEGGYMPDEDLLALAEELERRSELKKQKED